MRDWPAIVRPQFERAVFLDRDGTLNVDTHFPHELEHLTLMPGVDEALSRLGRLPVHLIVISNQAGLALGLYPLSKMHAFNAELRRRVAEAGGRIDAFYYCPHKEPKHLQPGEQACACSKPAPGLFFDAASDFGIDLEHSFMVGDRGSDVAAGAAAGCRTILLGDDDTPGVLPDWQVPDLLGAAAIIEREIGRIRRQRAGA